MKRKLERLAAKLAFDEIDSAQTEKTRNLVSEHPESARLLSEYEGIRADLKKLTDATPECSLSTDRLREAILGDGLGRSARSRQSWNWVLAPIATGVLAYAFMAYGRGQSGSTPLTVLPGTPTYATMTGDGNGTSDEALRTGLDFKPALPHSKPSAVAERTQSSRRRIQSSKSQSLTVDLTAERVAVSMLATSDAKKDGLPEPPPVKSAGAPVATERAAVGGESKSAPALASPAAQGGDGLVLIGSEPDGDTGAPRAREVESFANVSIGG